MDLAKEYQPRGVRVVAISSNSVETHPQDGPAEMAKDAQQYGEGDAPAQAPACFRLRAWTAAQTGARRVGGVACAWALRVGGAACTSVCRLPGQPHCRLFLLRRLSLSLSL